MSISTPTNILNFGSATDTTVYTTGTVSPSANGLLLLFVTSGHATAPEVPTIGGTLGLTWTQLQSDLSLSPATLRGSLYWAKTNGSPPSGTLSFTHATTHSSCQASITQILTADLTTPIVQSDVFRTTTTDNPGITLSAIGAGNATLGFNVWNSATALPAGSGYTELSVSPTTTTPTIIHSVEYLIAGSATVDWTTTSNATKCIFAVEVADATGITQALPVATITNTAQALTRTKKRAVQATETEAGQALARVRKRALTIATAANTAQALARAKKRALAISTETELARNLSHVMILPKGLETETAVSFVRKKGYSGFGGAEIEDGQAVARSKSRALPVATETETGQAYGRKKVWLFQAAIQTDEAIIITEPVSPELPNAEEIEFAVSPIGSKRKLLPVATEHEIAFRFPSYLRDLDLLAGSIYGNPLKPISLGGNRLRAELLGR